MQGNTGVAGHKPDVNASSVPRCRLSVPRPAIQGRGLGLDGLAGVIRCTVETKLRLEPQLVQYSNSDGFQH